MVALALFLLVVVACSYPAAYPTRGRRDFIAADPRLAQALLDAAIEWTDAGVLEAGYVTVNVEPNGVPVRFAARSDLARLCYSVNDPHGCTSFTKEGKYEAIYVDSEVTDERLRQVLLHELIHVLLALNEHTPGDGIFNANANTREITEADLDWLCLHTECLRGPRAPRLAAAPLGAK